jgi:FG-GAP-like repeat
VNGDGKADLIWQDVSGTLGVWEMNGTTPIAEGGIGNPGANWKVIGAADFNGDSRDDILLQNSATGNQMIDLMNGTSITSTVSITVGDPSWHAVSTGVFNGVTEIAWQNTNGTVGLWLMNGTALAAQVGLSNPGAGWELVSMDHFTPNGQADLLFQNGNTGAMQLWETNATSIVAEVNLPNPGAGWILQNGHPFASG